MWALHAVACLTSGVAAPLPKAVTMSQADMHSMKQLFSDEKAAAAARRDAADAVQQKLTALGSARNLLWPLPPKLKPHDIPVIELQTNLTSAALNQLLDHEACAVVVRGFVDTRTCDEIADRIRSRDNSFSNWNIHQASDDTSDTSFAATEVDKIGVTSGEALEDFCAFKSYLDPTSPTALDGLLPGRLNPFTVLRECLNDLHAAGCRRVRLGRWSLPVGTFRRMHTSRGLIHADTATLLSQDAGEFSANIYVRVPPGRGALSVFPAQQYAPSGRGVVSPALLADLQSLSLLQSAGFDGEAQATLRAALPIKRTIELQDGDLVLINTGRFHGVEPYADRAYRLSGQCWLSYRRDKALRMWV